MSTDRVASLCGTRLVYACLALLALSQILSFTYLQRYIVSVESKLERAQARPRSRRDLDNAVLSADESVEFFNPSLREQLEEGEKAKNISMDQWVWLTAYSRIPVS